MFMSLFIYYEIDIQTEAAQNCEDSNNNNWKLLFIFSKEMTLFFLYVPLNFLFEDVEIIWKKTCPSYATMLHFML